MRLFALTSLVMLAFAANSVLNRMAVGVAGLDPALAAVLRLGAGAGVLMALVLARRGTAALRVAPGVAAAGMATLFLYILGFTLANGRIDAGIGALILFGSVQITMFAAALLWREPVGRWRVIGAGVAFSGLAVLMLPAGGAAVDPTGAALMALGGIGWGLYSLNGRRAGDALAATAVNFTLALVPALVWLGLGQGTPAVTWGIWPALLSGAVTSGMGYALWYAVVPRLAASLAAVAQLSVPVLAALGGAALLAEVPGPRFWFAAALVIGGIALSLRRN
ncbi:MAG: DMT family transporter [Paenirhodobacter sp.]|uniref:DMT family transporter n=1 Tax=Paenirhodobacter sp. TaxID=1965326 RepID=UPI003D0968FB